MKVRARQSDVSQRETILFLIPRALIPDCQSESIRTAVRPSAVNQSTRPSVFGMDMCEFNYHSATPTPVALELGFSSFDAQVYREAVDRGKDECDVACA